MIREVAKELLPIIQAFSEDKDIEYSKDWELWLDTNTPTWDTDYVYRIKPEPKYRIKPESKYRPFKSQEECWNEMLKHHPFVWVKSKDKGYFHLIGSVQFASKLEDVMITFATSDNLARSSHYIYENYILLMAHHSELWRNDYDNGRIYKTRSSDSYTQRNCEGISGKDH